MWKIERVRRPKNKPVLTNVYFRGERIQGLTSVEYSVEVSDTGENREVEYLTLKIAPQDLAIVDVESPFDVEKKIKDPKPLPGDKDFATRTLIKGLAAKAKVDQEADD